MVCLRRVYFILIDGAKRRLNFRSLETLDHFELLLFIQVNGYCLVLSYGIQNTQILLNILSSINLNDLSRNMTGFFGGQKRHQIRKIFRLAYAL